MKKTDWQIARGLADWVISLGLPTDGQHQKWANYGELPYFTDEDYIQTYISNDFVSLEYFKGGEKVNELSIHSSSFGKSFGLGADIPTPADLKQAVSEYADTLNIRYWNLVYRNKLRWLETSAKQRLEESKQAEIERLEDKLNNLKGAK